MTIKFEDIQKANDQIKTTDIKGKAYAEVNQRIRAFRMLYPKGSIQTEIVRLENGICVMKAVAIDEQGVVLGTGTALEKESSSFINKTSFVENCETSAVGRALAMCGLGIDASIASKEEVENAIKQQEEDTIINEEVKLGKCQSFIDNYFYTMPGGEEQRPKFMKKYKLETLADFEKLTKKKQDQIITGMKNELAKEQKTGIYSQEETF